MYALMNILFLLSFNLDLLSKWNIYIFFKKQHKIAEIKYLHSQYIWIKNIKYKFSIKKSSPLKSSKTQLFNIPWLYLFYI